MKNLSGKFKVEYPSFYNDPTDIKQLFFTINSVAHIFLAFFPSFDPTRWKICFSDQYTNPLCDRSNKQIIITSPPGDWNRVAYQFSHELCHAVIPSDVPDKFRWFEESICEMASYYVLPEVGKYWRSSGNFFKYYESKTKNKQFYFYTFSQYVKKDKQKAIPFPVDKLFSNEYRHLLESMTINPEQRGYNAQVAQTLLSVFNQHPDTWHFIQFLPKMDSSLSFREAIKGLFSLTPEDSHPGLNLILETFGLS